MPNESIPPLNPVAPTEPTPSAIPNQPRLSPKPEDWQTPLTGHGIPCFREMLVDYRTLQWINPYASAAATARKEADDKSAAVTKAEEALAQSATPGDPTLKKLLEDAKTAAALAEQSAGQAEKKKSTAEQARVAAEKIINDLIAKFDGSQAVWSDLLEFESAFLRLLTGEKLRARYESIAAEYKGLTGDAAPATPPEEEALRARAETLLADLHWAYTTGPVQEKQRGRMVAALGLVTIAVFLAGLLMVYGGGFSVLPWVAMAGAAGAALSAFQRAQSRDVKGDALTNCQKNSDFWSLVCGNGSFALAPVIGALSAIVLAHILAAGIVTGSVFPGGPSTNSVPKAVVTNQSSATATSTRATSTSPSANGLATTSKPAAASSNAPVRVEPGTAVARTNGSDSGGALPVPKFAQPDRGADDSEPLNDNGIGLLRRCWRFESCKDLALLLVWSFIAGFSERLVPDLISRLTARAKVTS